MKGWQSIIQKYHDWAHKDDEYSLLIQPPASKSIVVSLEKQWGFALPQEFMDIYLTSDGFGVTSEAGKVYWLLTPMKELGRLEYRARDMIEGTHSEISKRYFPFIDWSDGDSTGYLLSESGDLLPGLYTLNHERYYYEDGQDHSEFFYTIYGSIEEFLRPPDS